MATADKFYEQLEGFAEFSQFTQLKWYRPLPSTWFVLITDVKGSTAAIEEGLYREVNSLGAASIVVLLNAVAPIRVPYVFGRNHHRKTRIVSCVSMRQSHHKFVS